MKLSEAGHVFFPHVPRSTSMKRVIGEPNVTAVFERRGWKDWILGRRKMRPKKERTFSTLMSS